MSAAADPADLIAAAEGRRRAGRMDEAIALLEAATRAAPGDGRAWSALAATLAGANRPDLALPAWERAAALALAPAAALAGRGRALQALARPGEAAAAFRAALAAAPTSAEARYGLALLAFEAGDYEEAAAQAARLPPTSATAWLAARIALARGAHEEARRILEEWLAGGGGGEAARADTLLLLGEALDRLGRRGEAFAAAMAGKALQRRLFAPRAAGREGEVARLRRLAAWFAGSPPWAARAAASPGADEPRAHVFLVGFPRSGTTLLEQALAAHSEIATLEEAPTLAQARRALMADAEGLARLARLEAGEAARWRADYWRVVAEHGVAPAGRVFVDKAPAGASDLPLVAALFPAARVLFALRDPRDAVLSCAMSAFQMNALTYAFTDLGETAACYDAAMALARLYRQKLPGLAILEVRHEALVEDPAGVLRAAAGFIGVEFEPAMADFPAAGRTVRTPSGTQVRAGLDRRGLARWRGYGAELAPVMGVLAPWVTALGYGEE